MGRFLMACRAEPVDCTPVWFMRQAGRYMPEYRRLRSKHSMLEVLRSSELSAAITLQPIRAFDVDAAIIFSDILPPLAGMGLDLEYVPGRGPQLSHPLATKSMIDRLATPPATETIGGTLEAIRLVKRELGAVPLIGFAGGPFTLASYAVEGGGSKHFARTKRLMLSEPAAWDRLMTKLVTVVTDLLTEQQKAGADVLQVFDTWAGVLSRFDYERCVAPYNRKLFKHVHALGVPILHFSTGTSAYLDLVAHCGGDVIGADWRIPLDEARKRTGKPVMGNLDPTALLAPWRELQPRIDFVLDRAGGSTGHVFNLGHGILPETPVDNVRRVVDYVHAQTTKK